MSPYTADSPAERTDVDPNCKAEYKQNTEEVAFVERLPQALSYVANLEVGDHAILFYDNLVVAAEYFCAYIEEGINRQETTCIMGLPRERYERLFSHVGIKVAPLENCGYLRHLPMQHLRADYTPPIRQSIEGLLKTNMESECRGTRFVILSEWPLNHTSSLELIEFEKWLGTIPHPASVICCYDAGGAVDEVNSNLFTGLLKAHGHCIFQGMGLPTNVLLGDRLSAYPKLKAFKQL